MDVITCPACTCRLQLPEGERTTTFLCPRCQKEFSLEEAQAPRRPTNSVVSAPASPWKVGDRVLAPWDYPWLYPGTVETLDRDRLWIAFDDGDRGWADARVVQPLKLGVGDRVFGRQKLGKLYFPGTIDEADEGRIHISYDNGEEEWTTIRVVRVVLPEVREEMERSLINPPRPAGRSVVTPAPPADYSWVKPLLWVALIVGGALIRGCLR